MKTLDRTFAAHPEPRRSEAEARVEGPFEFAMEASQLLKVSLEGTVG
jgi:hypothetical protein